MGDSSADLPLIWGRRSIGGRAVGRMALLPNGRSIGGEQPGEGLWEGNWPARPTSDWCVWGRLGAELAGRRCRGPNGVVGPHRGVRPAVGGAVGGWLLALSLIGVGGANRGAELVGGRGC